MDAEDQVFSTFSTVVCFNNLLLLLMLIAVGLPELSKYSLEIRTNLMKKVVQGILQQNRAGKHKIRKVSMHKIIWI